MYLGTFVWSTRDHCADHEGMSREIHKVAPLHNSTTYLPLSPYSLQLFPLEFFPSLPNLVPQLKPIMTPPPEPDLLSPGVGMSATGFVDELKFQEYVLDTIRNASEPQELIFTHVKSSWGECIVDLINETADGLSTR